MKKLMIGLLTLALVLVGSMAAVMPVSASVFIPPLVRATISPVKATIAAGTSQTYVVTGYDASNTPYNISWSCLFIIDPAAGGSWSSNTFHSVAKGPFSLFALYAGLPEPITATLTVTNGAPVSIALLPATGSVVAGSPKNFCVIATDAGGNKFNVSSATDFSIDKGAGGTWAMGKYNMTYTPGFPGVWTVTATYGSLTPVTSTLTVPHGPAVSIAITPAASTASGGTSKAFSAVGKDAWGNTFNVTGSTDFYIQKGAGGSWTANKYNKAIHRKSPGHGQ